MKNLSTKIYLHKVRKNWYMASEANRIGYTLYKYCKQIITMSNSIQDKNRYEKSKFQNNYNQT